jgi:hypothetical protein
MHPTLGKLLNLAHFTHLSLCTLFFFVNCEIGDLQCTVYGVPCKIMLWCSILVVTNQQSESPWSGKDIRGKGLKLSCGLLGFPFQRTYPYLLLPFQSLTVMTSSTPPP